jgi:hypothetical protein
MDKIIIVSKHVAFIIFFDRTPVCLISDRDVREVIYMMFDIHRRLVNDDVTQKIEVAS